MSARALLFLAGNLHLLWLKTHNGLGNVCAITGGPLSGEGRLQ